MAKIWTLSEAFNALKAHDKASIMDFGGRFPLSTHALEQAREAEVLLSGLPDHMTMRKLEAALKEGVKPIPEADEDDEAMTQEEAKEAREKEEAKKAEKKEPPKKEASRKAAKKPEPEPEDEEPEEEEEKPDYSGMTAPELFKLCKKRGIKAEPKKKGDYYIKLLEEDDAKAEEEPEDDSWDDEEEEEKEAKKAPAKKASKGKKTEEEDDEDDWDI